MKNIPIRRIKIAQKEPIFSEGFSIRNVEDLLAGKDLVQDLHRHDFFFILALKTGKGNHEIDFIPYEVSNFSIFFMRPGQVHQLNLKAGSSGYLMQFNSDFYYPNDKPSGLLLRKVSTKNICQLDAKRIQKLFDILTYISDEYSSKQEGYQDVIKANLGIFFIELVRHRKNKIETKVKSNNYIQERTEEFLGLLEANITMHKQVSEYAEMLNVSPYQLNSITKNSLGKNCSEIINDYIILESKRFLLATSNQISQVAYDLGYEDVSYFIRFFKKHTGYSPEAFRHK